jgi:hypothetical protein
MTVRIIKMPNHYDIDIHCKKCGAYICSIGGDESSAGIDKVCRKCASKTTKSRFEIWKEIDDEMKHKRKHKQ